MLADILVRDGVSIREQQTTVKDTAAQDQIPVADLERRIVLAAL